MNIREVQSIYIPKPRELGSLINTETENHEINTRIFFFVR